MDIKKTKEEVQIELHQSIMTRLKEQLIRQGHRHDVIEAILSTMRQRNTDQ